jgi:hypothetical protein
MVFKKLYKIKTIIYTTTAVSTFWVLILFYLASFVNVNETHRAIRICFLSNLFIVLIPFALGVILYYVRRRKVHKYEQLYEQAHITDSYKPEELIEKMLKGELTLERKIMGIEANFNFWIKIPLWGGSFTFLLVIFCTSILEVAYPELMSFHRGVLFWLFLLYYCFVYLSYWLFTLEEEFY